MNYLKYYFKLLILNTRYIELCTLMIIISFLFCISFIPHYHNIQLNELGLSSLFPFFVNISQSRVLYTCFMLITSLICTLPITQILINERKNKVMIMARVKKNKIYIYKLFISFISSFSLIFISLFSNLIFSLIITNCKNLDFIYMSTPIVANNSYLMKLSIPLYNLYLSNPLLLTIFYMFMISIYGGLLSLFVVSIENFIYNKIIIYTIPFIFIVLNTLLSFLFPSLIELLDIICTISNIFVYLFVYLIIFLIITVISYMYYFKKDIY